MRLLRYLLLLPRLVEAIAYAGLIVIATPLLAMLVGRRRSHRGPIMTDAEDIPENTPDQRRLLAAAEALDTAGIPRTGETLGLEIDLPERIQRLTHERDDLARANEARSAEKYAEEARERRAEAARIDAVLRAAGAPMDELTAEQGATWLGRELLATQDRANNAESNLSTLHVQLRQMFGAESVAEALADAAALKEKCEELSKDRLFLTTKRREAEEELAHFVSQRDAEVAGFMKQRDEALAKAQVASEDAGALASENLRLERLVKQLTSKVKRLESAGSGARFALASAPRGAILRADIVVDAKSGKVIKNRFGKAPGMSAALAAGKPKAKARKRA